MTAGSSLRGMSAKVGVKFSLELSGLPKKLKYIFPLFEFIPKALVFFFLFLIVLSKNDVLFKELTPFQTPRVEYLRCGVGASSK